MDSHVYILFRFTSTNSRNWKWLLKFFIFFIFIGVLVYWCIAWLNCHRFILAFLFRRTLDFTCSTTPNTGLSTNSIHFDTTTNLSTPEPTLVPIISSTQTSSSGSGVAVQNTTILTTHSISTVSTTNNIWNPISGCFLLLFLS